MEQEYYLGLDMGTGSVGWAVTDSEYHVLRKHGKALWGVRLFESASTAEERRMFRTSRRRLDRRNWRIEILQEIFAEEISKKDPGFFLRMKESKYYPEDKRDINGNCLELPYALFVDDDFTDKDYHKKFPTIYHLRKMLMNTEETPDIRLVYLAIHHMMKHRGHFLLSGDINEIKEFGTTFSKLLENIKNEELDWNLELGKEEYAVVESILKDNMLNRSTKKTRLIKALKAKSICEKAVLNLLAGGTVKLSDIFGLEELNETERPKISFADNGYDDYIGEVENELGEQFYIIETAKAVYDWAVLVEILGKYTSISEAKVATYEKHKSDLQFLKKIVRKYLTKEEYKDIFVSTSDKLKNYSAYIGMTKINGKKVDLQSKRCSKEEFYDFIKKNVLKKLEGQPEYEYLKEELERETFLPKQVNRDNGVIPYQIHLYELKKILGNLRDKIDLIKENEDKLVQLFEFRIPYYVGPLNKIDDGKEGKFTYFNAMFGLDFTRTEDNYINAALNYGYSIILSTFTREVVSNGYITQLGIFHDNMFNQFNLASDLMEPFRVLVDQEVYNMRLEQFEHEEKMLLVNILNKEIQIDGRIQYVNNAIKIYCKSIFDALNEDDSALIRFYKIEL